MSTLKKYSLPPTQQFREFEDRILLVLQALDRSSSASWTERMTKRVIHFHTRKCLILFAFCTYVVETKVVIQEVWVGFEVHNDQWDVAEEHEPHERNRGFATGSELGTKVGKERQVNCRAK